MLAYQADQADTYADSPQIHRAKAEKQREKVLKDEMDAKRAKTKAARERRQERIAGKRQALDGEEEEEEEAETKA